MADTEKITVGEQQDHEEIPQQLCGAEAKNDRKYNGFFYIIESDKNAWRGSLHLFPSTHEETRIWCRLCRENAGLADFWKLFVRLCEYVDEFSVGDGERAVPKDMWEARRRMKEILESLTLKHPVYLILDGFESIPESPVRKLLLEWERGMQLHSGLFVHVLGNYQVNAAVSS